MIRQQRQTLVQEFNTIPFTAGVAASPISASLGPSSLVSTVIFSVPTGAANSVFLGTDAGVTILSGLEIPPGSPQQYRVVNERELVEVESVLLDLLLSLTCRRSNADIVPIVVWDLSKMYLIAVAPTNMAIGVFKEMWI